MNFSPYTPPPDEQPLNSPPITGGGGGGKKSKLNRPWFSRDASSFVGGYQSGGTVADPTSNQPSYLTSSTDPESQIQATYSSSSGGFGNTNAYTDTTSGAGSGAGAGTNPWETRWGLRVDLEAAGCYVGGPVTALLFIILETTNEYVRFHAYQSALLTTPLLLLGLVLKFLVWKWLWIVFVIFSLLLTLYTAFRAFRDPSSLDATSNLNVQGGGAGIPRYYLPFIGDYAERWVGGDL